MARTIGWSATATGRNNIAVLRPMATEVSCFVNATVIRINWNALAQITGVPSDKAGPDCAAYLEGQGCVIMQIPQEQGKLSVYIHDDTIYTGHLMLGSGTTVRMKPSARISGRHDNDI